VRHGSTAWTTPFRRYQGRVDVPLLDAGRDEAASVAEVLSADGLSTIWHSPLGRTAETAEIIAARLGAELRPDVRLAELSFGSWEGLSHEEVRLCQPEAHDRRLIDVCGGTPPGAEPIASLMDRLAAFLAERSAGEGRCGVVTHEGVIRAAAVLLGLLPLPDFYRFSPPPGSALEVIPNGSAYRLRIHSAPANVPDPLRRTG
jgi:broad specificity phosphatase PhoE